MKLNGTAKRLETVWEAETQFAVKPAERGGEGRFCVASEGKPDAMPGARTRILVLELDLPEATLHRTTGRGAAAKALRRAFSSQDVVEVRQVVCS